MLQRELGDLDAGDEVDGSREFGGMEGGEDLANVLGRGHKDFGAIDIRAVLDGSSKIAE